MVGYILGDIFTNSSGQPGLNNDMYTYVYESYGDSKRGDKIFT
jgi:hypothetical protein